MERKEKKNLERAGKTVTTAALIGACFLSGCDAKEELITQKAEIKDNEFGFAEGYDQDGIFMEISANDKERFIQGPAIIKHNPDNNDIKVIYPGVVYQLEQDAVVWEYKEGETKKMTEEWLETQIKYFEGGEVERITCQDSFRFAEGYDSQGQNITQQKVEGPAIIKPNSDNNDLIVIYPGQTYSFAGDGILWKFDGDSEEKMIEGLRSQYQFFKDGDITEVKPSD